MHSPHGAFFRKFTSTQTSTMSQFINYLKDTQAELKHVSWPTQKQSIIYTALVVGVSILVALYVGLFDFIFSRALSWFIN